jgi:hypothetical protein
MNVFQRLKERRRRKAHQRYLAERERQKALEGRDPEQVAHDTSLGAAIGGQNVGSGHW